MKPVLIFVSVLFLILIPVAMFAQEAQDVEDLKVGVETATQLLADIPVTHMEDADTWDSNMPIDQGVIYSMKRRGRPLEIPEIDPNDGVENKYVLGVKVAYNQRGYAHFTVTPSKPIKIPGITKALTVWVCGRSFKHRLYAHILDYRGREMYIDLGPLDFVGWKQINAVLPSSIEQYNYHNADWRGISLNGLSIRTDPEDSYGVYYVYFDEIRAITDVYVEENRDEDDMTDGW